MSAHTREKKRRELFRTLQEMDRLHEWDDYIERTRMTKGTHRERHAELSEHVAKNNVLDKRHERLTNTALRLGKELYGDDNPVLFDKSAMPLTKDNITP